MNTNKPGANLALGTAQFGLPYGIANKRGQVSIEEVDVILRQAHSAGIDTLDTAIAYGASEYALGQHDLSQFSIVSKLPDIPADCGDVAGWAERELHGSLLRLGIDRLSGLLLHRPKQLLEPHGESLYKALCALRKQGLTGAIGVSVYEIQELELLSGRYQFDLVQAPFNVVDRRILDSGWLDRLRKGETLLHCRSVFMQGLLLMSTEQRPRQFARWSSLWDLWGEWLTASGLTPLQACLRYVLNVRNIERVVVGVDSLPQLQEILQASVGDCPPLPDQLECSDSELLNPALWSHL